MNIDVFRKKSNILDYLILDIFFIWYSAGIDITVAWNVYKKRFTKILWIDQQYFDSKWSSKITTTSQEAISAITNFTNRLFITVLPAIFRILSAFVFIYIFTNWKFFIISVIIFVIYIFITYKVQLKARPNRTSQNKNNWDRNKHLSKVLSSKTENIISNKLSYETNILIWYLNKTLSIVIERMKILIPQNSQNIITPLSKIWSYIYFFNSFMSGNMSFGTIYIINDSVNRVFQSINDTINIINDTAEYYNKLEEFQTEIVEAPQIIGYHEWQQYIYRWWNILLDDISFAYTKFSEDKKISDISPVHIDGTSFLESEKKDIKYIFQNFSMNIVWWSKVAFVWPSGGGKTTLVKLIIWLLNTTTGNIYIDSQKLPNTYTSRQEYISLSSYYAHVWYLSQDPWVFDGSILDNLLYWLSESSGNKENSKDLEWSDIINNIKSDNIANLHISKDLDKYFTPEILAILSKYIFTEAELSDLVAKVKLAVEDSKCNFVRDYDDGLLTQIGERWVKLSGGQKQRLAIAKLMIKDPAIIVLDEPTSALDSFSEDGVTVAMERLFENRTTIIIAHRLQTVRKADQILYIQDGKIMESWKHEQLLAAKWEYYKMVELQSGF